MRKKPTYLSLFCGCGGFDEGFEHAGFECRGAIDIDKTVLDVYSKNLGGRVFQHDLSGGSLPGPLNFEQVDVLVSGSPCQGFSTAGLRRFSDPRNSLLTVTSSVAKITKPKVIVCENVMGSLLGQHKHYWDKLISELTQLNYNTKVIQLNSLNFGVAQSRRRVFLMASQDDTLFDIQPVKNSRISTIREALTDIDGLFNQTDLVKVENEVVKKIIRRIKGGQKLCNVRGGEASIPTWDIPEVFGAVSEKEIALLKAVQKLRRKIRYRNWGDADPVDLKDIQNEFNYDVSPLIIPLLNKGYLRKLDTKYDLSHTFNGLYKRLSWDKASLTVDTRFGNPRFFLHPDRDSGFTVREAARIQGFRDSFKFEGNINSQFKMIGNAVPPPLANLIANEIKAVFF